MHRAERCLELHGGGVYRMWITKYCELVLFKMVDFIANEFYLNK